MCSTMPISRSCTSGLPSDPHISPWVRIWKGTAKTYASLAAIAAFVVGAVVHHVSTGSVPVTDADEEKGRKVVEGKE